MRTKPLAFAAGVVLGLFLFLRFKFSTPWLAPGISLIQLWSQSALLLAGIGLAGTFRDAWLWGPFGASVAPILYVWGMYEGFRRPNPETLGFMMVLVLLTASAPLAGGTIQVVLRNRRISRSFYRVVLASALTAGAVIPVISGISHRSEEEAQEGRQTKQISDLLKDIYKAEVAYSEDRPDRAFTCEGYRLRLMTRRLWQTADYWSKSLPQRAESLGIELYITRANNVGYDHGVFVILDCSQPHGFRASAFGDNPPTWAFSIDETGHLMAPEDPTGSQASRGR